MRIVIVGCGNVGATLTEQLTREGHNVTVIDEKQNVVNSITNNYDVLGVVGNGASFEVQSEAGVKDADLLIAVTGKDELNLLCCLIAKKSANCHTIARVSNPVYSREISFIKEELGLSMIINPQYAAAQEIARLLKFPFAETIDTFTKGRVELIKFTIDENSDLCNLRLREITTRLRADGLISVVERGDEVYIPDGNFMIKAGDRVTVAGTTNKNLAFFKKIKMPTAKAKTAMIVGGGETTFYLASQLIEMGVQVKIIERDHAKCEELSEKLPQALIIEADGTDKGVLLEEGLAGTEAFIALTNIDEENIMLAMYAKSLSNAKPIAKVHRVSYDEIIDDLNIGSIIYPKYITAASIVRYVRAMHNSMGSNIETLYRMNDNKVEALEFIIKEDCPFIGKPLSDVELKDNVLICSINHKGNITIPQGSSVIQPGDTVVLVTTSEGVKDICDVVAK